MSHTVAAMRMPVLRSPPTSDQRNIALITMKATAARKTRKKSCCMRRLPRASDAACRLTAAAHVSYTAMQATQRAPERYLPRSSGALYVIQEDEMKTLGAILAVLGILAVA